MDEPRARLLIVEDDADIRETLSEALELEGYGVVQAANGREGLEALAAWPRVDAILLDLMMPVLSGWEFRRVQRDDPALSGIPVVVISASQPDGVEPDRYLPKPFSITKLLETIDGLLRARGFVAA